MSKPWKPGCADEAWKVAICDRDIGKATECLNFLVYVATDAGNDLQRGIEQLRGMSGDELISAVLRYRLSAEQSIANGKSSA